VSSAENASKAKIPLDRKTEIEFPDTVAGNVRLQRIDKNMLLYRPILRCSLASQSKDLERSFREVKDIATLDRKPSPSTSNNQYNLKFCKTEVSKGADCICQVNHAPVWKDAGN
jgi:hypothetical protein